ncbi:DNA helicase [Ralstonia phage RS-PII-1]|uniref:DNA helicase n=1 Tax=Ralstonia phage RS-PII-1 TaxID=1932892 RepID=A0A1L7DQC0_9CAUD|nr:DNA helicase [Ralstonia phage RS-PII-1]APU00319.1 DNA helicase [Ralstonia phage RS-PII-1]
MDTKTLTVLKDFGAYFKANPGVNVIRPESFHTFFTLQHPKLKPETLALYAATIKEIAQPAPPGTEDGILERLVGVATATKLASLLEQYDSGEADITVGLRNLAERHENWMARQKDHPKVRDRIEDILVEEENDAGLRFRLNCLNEAMRPLRSGDFGIVAARVDTGKSSFFASELSFMAAQVDEVWPGQERSIIVLNNEGPGKRLKHRFYNAALEATTQQLVEWKNDGSLYSRYVEAQGGRDKFFVYDIHDYSMSQLEDIVKDVNPCLVVVDMLDNVACDIGASNGGTRTDQLLESLYQRARVWAVKYDCAVIATSQLSAEAENVAYPLLSMLANSKTGKAGAADFVLCIGRSNAEGLENTRFIGLPKNKKRRDGGKQDPKKEVYFDGARALFTDC